MFLECQFSNLNRLSTTDLGELKHSHYDVDERMPADPTHHEDSADDASDRVLVDSIRRDSPANATAWTELFTKYQHRLYAVCLKMVHDRDAAADLTQDSFVKIIQGLNGYDGRSKLSTWMIRVTMNTCLSYLRGQKHRRHASLNLSTQTGNYGYQNPPEQVGVYSGRLTDEKQKATEKGDKRRSSPEKPSQSELASKSDDQTADSHPMHEAVRSKPKKQAGQHPIFTGPGGPGKTTDWREQTREQTPDESVKLQERRRLVADALNALPLDQRAILVLRDVQDLDYEQIAQAMDLAVGTVKSRLFRARLAFREAIEAADTAKQATMPAVPPQSVLSRTESRVENPKP